MIPCYCLCLIAAQLPSPDGDQFSRLVRGLLSEIRDYEFICEGKIQLLTHREDKEKQARFNVTFQTRFAYRSDGWIAMDTYRRQTDGGGLLRRRRAVLRGTRLEQRDEYPDGRLPPNFSSVSRGSLDSLSDEGSPLHFLSAWRWIHDFDPGKHGFHHGGYEDVDGHRCARVEVDRIPKLAAGRKSLEISWVDMQRGGNVLKFEHYRRGHLVFRSRDVKLSQVDLPGGQSVWFPIGGIFETFLDGLEYIDMPVFREEYTLVRGTLRINQGLPDARFSLKWNGSKSESVNFQGVEDEFAKAEKSAPRPARTDPVAAQKLLESRVAEAERQDRQLKASTPESRAFNPTTILQATLAAIGVAAIAGAIVLKRRA